MRHKLQRLCNCCNLARASPVPNADIKRQSYPAASLHNSQEESFPGISYCQDVLTFSTPPAFTSLGSHHNQDVLTSTTLPNFNTTGHLTNPHGPSQQLCKESNQNCRQLKGNYQSDVDTRYPTTRCCQQFTTCHRILKQAKGSCQCPACTDPQRTGGTHQKAGEHHDSGDHGVKMGATDGSKGEDDDWQNHLQHTHCSGHTIKEYNTMGCHLNVMIVICTIWVAAAGPAAQSNLTCLHDL